jgi:small-conductance mechanosensitive channel
MITTRDVAPFIQIIPLVLAYLLTATIVGYFRALIAKLMGDTTAERAGFLTLNPLAHIDVVGAIFLLMFQFGWGKDVPINPHAFHGPFAKLKMIITYLAGTIGYIIVAAIAFLMLLYIFGPNVTYLAFTMVVSRNISLLPFTTTYTTISSLSISLAVIMVAIIYLSVLLAVCNFLVNGFKLATATIFKNSGRFHDQDYLTFIIPMILIFLLAPLLSGYMLLTVHALGSFFAKIMGIV